MGVLYGEQLQWGLRLKEIKSYTFWSIINNNYKID